jgi:hypothetical protein
MVQRSKPAPARLPPSGRREHQGTRAAQPRAPGFKGTGADGAPQRTARAAADDLKGRVVACLDETGVGCGEYTAVQTSVALTAAAGHRGLRRAGPPCKAEPRAAPSQAGATSAQPAWESGRAACAAARAPVMARCGGSTCGWGPVHGVEGQRRQQQQQPATSLLLNAGETPLTHLHLAGSEKTRTRTPTHALLAPSRGAAAGRGRLAALDLPHCMRSRQLPVPNPTQATREKASFAPQAITRTGRGPHIRLDQIRSGVRSDHATLALR